MTVFSSRRTATILSVWLAAGVPATAQTGQPDPSLGTQTAATSTTADGLLPEPPIIGRSIEFVTRLVRSGGGDGEKSGFYPELGNMVSGSGWISLGPGYRRWLRGDRVLIDGSAAVSWRTYKMAQGRIELTNLARSRLAVGSQVRWQDYTQVTYFGEGPDSLEANRSEYRVTSGNVIGYATLRATPWLSINGTVGWLTRPHVDSPTGSFKRGNPFTREVFPEDPVFAREQQPNYLHGEAAIIADTRDHHSYPTEGGLYRAAWARYSDRDLDTFTFQRYEAEAAQFVPLANGRLVFAVHGWVVATDSAATQTVPFYLQPGLGGSRTLRSYSSYRFHDRHLASVNAESRIALFAHVDAAVFFDAGNVAARFDDLNLDRTSYGVGLRLHSRTSTFGRLDIANGAEGWKVLVRLSDPFRFGRLSRRTAAIPFAP
jgi:hypothetical protein